MTKASSRVPKKARRVLNLQKQPRENAAYSPITPEIQLYSLYIMYTLCTLHVRVQWHTCTCLSSVIISTSFRQMPMTRLLIRVHTFPVHVTSSHV